MAPRRRRAGSSPWSGGSCTHRAVHSFVGHRRGRVLNKFLPVGLFGALFLVQQTVSNVIIAMRERAASPLEAFPPKNFPLGRPTGVNRANAALGSFGHGRCHRQAVARHLAAIQSVPPVPPDRTRHGTGRRATPPTTPTAGVLLPPPLPLLRRSPGTRVQASLRPRGVGRHPKSVGAARRRRDSAAAEVAAARTRWSTAAARQAAEVRGRFRPRRRLSRRTGFRMETQASRQERSRTRGRARPLPLRFHGLAPLRARGARRGWISHRTSSRSPIPNPSPIPNRKGGGEATHVDQGYLGLRCGVSAHRGPIEQASPAQRQARPKAFGTASRAFLSLRRTAARLRKRRRGSAQALRPRWTCKTSFSTPRRGTGPPAL